MGDLDGLKAVVTGSGGLMGGPIAVHLAARGADVLLNDRREGLTDRYAQHIADLGRDTVSVVGSVLRAADAERVISTAEQRWGRVDILVNVVGGIKGLVFSNLWEMTEDDWDATMAVNLKGTFLCTKLVVPGMIERRCGKIVNIASIAWGGDPRANPAYVTAKAGIVALTRALAGSLAPWDINVNAVAPGVTQTGVLDKLSAAAAEQPDGPQPGTYPLGRVNDPEDIASAVGYLVSPAARNVSGQLLTVAAGANPSL